MKNKGHSEQRDIQNSGTVLNLRWLIASTVLLASVGIASFAAGFAIAKQENDIKASIQQTKLCRKVSSGEVQAVDAASIGNISGVEDIVADLQNVQVELVKKRIIYIDEHPIIIKLKSQETALKSLLHQRLQGVCNAVN